jgi:hypothetical protein
MSVYSGTSTLLTTHVILLISIKNSICGKHNVEAMIRYERIQNPQILMTSPPSTCNDYNEKFSYSKSANRVIDGDPEMEMRGTQRLHFLHTLPDCSMTMTESIYCL